MNQDDAQSVFIPSWERPIRIPERIPLCHANPEVAFAGRRGEWRLPLRLAAAAQEGTPLRAQVFGGRNSKGRFEDLQADRPAADGYVTIRRKDGTPIPLAANREGTFDFDAPDGGLAEGEELTLVLGDRSEGGGGAVPAVARMLNKFVVIYRPPSRDAEYPSFWSEETRQWILAACVMHILGGPIRALRVHAPSQARPGEEVSLLVRPLDEYRNLSHQSPEGLSVWLGQERLAATEEPVPRSTCVRLRIQAPREGALRPVVKMASLGLEAVANPIVCSEAPRDNAAFWGMIHGHTENSDGCGSLDLYFHQLREETGLDFGAPGDHDHLVETPESHWLETREAVKRWRAPGRFMTLLGYEWAKWDRDGEGDRNVYFLEDDRPMYRSDPANYPRPTDLFGVLREANEKAIVIPHHTGHGGNFCDWSEHDPGPERLVEIYQCRGSYECLAEEGNPLPDEIGSRPTVPQGYVNRALAMGWRVGFTGGGDDHNQHAGEDYPLGNVQPGLRKAGLMCVLARERTREAIWEAMWNRRVIATTGARIILRYTLNGRDMGSELDAAELPELLERRALRIEFHGTAPLDRIDVIRSNKVARTFAGRGPDLAVEWEDTDPLDECALPPAKFCDRRFCFYYVRALQKDMEMAWASPVWIDPR